MHRTDRQLAKMPRVTRGRHDQQAMHVAEKAGGYMRSVVLVVNQWASCLSGCGAIVKAMATDYFRVSSAPGCLGMARTPHETSRMTKCQVDG